MPDYFNYCYKCRLENDRRKCNLCFGTEIVPNDEGEIILKLVEWGKMRKRRLARRKKKEGRKK